MQRTPSAMPAQVPKRSYTLEELRLNKIQAEQLLSPTDETLSGVRTGLQAAGLAGLTALFYGAHLQLEQLLSVVLGILFVFTADQARLSEVMFALAAGQGQFEDLASPSASAIRHHIRQQPAGWGPGTRRIFSSAASIVSQVARAVADEQAPIMTNRNLTANASLLLHTNM